MSEIQWDPFLGEWVIIAPHRDKRPVSRKICPFCIEKVAPYSIPNKYPALRSKGICEIVVESNNHSKDIAYFNLSEFVAVQQLFKKRFLTLCSQKIIKYVFIFRNFGPAVGVTLSHPHSQIQSYPFIPPKIQRELEISKKYFSKVRTCLYCDFIKKERARKSQIIFSTKHFLSILPLFAKWPYEVHILPLKHCGSLVELDKKLLIDLSKCLLDILRRYILLYNQEMPYVMCYHNIPCDNKDYNYYHFHIEIYPFKRSKNLLKYRAGAELGAGVTINPTDPYEKAQELRDIDISMFKTV